VRTNWARLRFNLGDMGGFLVIKLVKPTKVFCSWAPHQGGFDQILAPEAQADIGTTATRVLRETNATVGQELCGLDALDRIFSQHTELLALFFCDCGP
jgi:hypothetical protein